MKDPKEYLEKFNLKSTTKYHNYDYLYSSTLECIKQAQIDAYNEALDDAVENVDFDDNYICDDCNSNIDEQSILKLKK